MQLVTACCIHGKNLEHEKLSFVRNFRQEWNKGKRATFGSTFISLQSVELSLPRFLLTRASVHFTQLDKDKLTADRVYYTPPQLTLQAPKSSLQVKKISLKLQLPPSNLPKMANPSNPFLNIEHACAVRNIDRPFTFLRKHGFTHNTASQLVNNEVKEINLA